MVMERDESMHLHMTNIKNQHL